MDNIEKNVNLKDFAPTIDGILEGKQLERGFFVKFCLAVDSELANLAKQKPAIPYQCCPKCNGQGTVSKPLYVPGDINSWDSSVSNFVCNVCNGTKIIPMFVAEYAANKG